MQRIPSHRLAQVRELVSYRAKAKDISRLLGVPLEFVLEVFHNQEDPAARRPPNGATCAATSKHLRTGTRQLYVALACQYQALLRRNVDEIEALLAVFRDARWRYGETEEGQHLSCSTWITLCRHLGSGIALLWRCNQCGASTLVEDNRAVRMVRMRCLWCTHQPASALFDFTARSRRLGSRP